MFLRELAAKLGLDVDAQSFLKANLAFEGLKAAAQFAIGQIAKVGEAITETAERAEYFANLSKRTGIEVGALQGLGYAADLAGSSTAQMANSLKLLARQAMSAKSGTGDAAEAFQKLGVRVTDADGKIRPADDLFLELADKFEKMPDGLEKTGLAMRVFGRSGDQMITVLSEGREKLLAAREEAEAFGVVMSADVVEAGKDLNDNFTRLQKMGEGMARLFAGPLLRPLSDLIDRFVRWRVENAKLINSKITAFMTVIGKAYYAVGAAVEFVVKNWRMLAFVMGAYLIAQFVIHIAQLWALAAAYVAAGWAAVVAGAKAAAAWLAAAAPVAVLTAAILLAALAAEDLYYFLTGGDSVIGDMGPKWAKFLEEFSKPQVGDPWWLEALRNAGGFIQDLSTTVPRAISEIWDAFAEFFGWLFESLAKIANTQAKVLTFGLVDSVVDEKTANAVGYRAIKGMPGHIGSAIDAIGEARGTGDIRSQSLYAPGGQAGATTVVQAPQVTIHASTNATKEEIKAVAKDAVTEAMSTLAEETQSSIPR